MFASKPSKYFFEKRLAQKLQALGDTPVRILEIGGGRSEGAERLLQMFPKLEYVSIEPDAESVRIARERFVGDSRATIIHGLGYGQVKEKALEQPFDIVFSLSVLEHVKDLPRFIDFSIQCARPGGEVIHLYDLGHSLYPNSWKEWLQTRICNTPLLRFVPEHKVARYLSTKYVESLLEQKCDIEEITFNNMRNLVALVKLHMSEDLMSEIAEFEHRHFEKVSDVKKREILFPSVCFWTKRKRNS